MNLVTILGLIAATCTTISFLPQAIKTIRTRQVAGLSLVMYIVITTGTFLWLVYGVLIKDIPLVLANGITFVLTFIILFLIIKYGGRKAGNS